MKNSRPILIFAWGIFLTAILFSPFSLDLTLSTRFFGLSLTLFLSLLFLRLENQIKIEIPVVCGFLYVLYACISVSWSINKAEALFEASRQILGFSVFVIALWALNTNTEFFLKLFLRFSVIIFFVGFIPVIFQLLQSDIADKLSMYNVSGLNSHKNLYSSFLAVNLFFLIKAFRDFNGNWKSAALAAILGSLLMVALLRTKAVWLGLAFGFGLFYFLKFYAAIKEKKSLNFYLAIVIWLIVGNLFFLLAFPFITEKIIAHNNGSKIDYSTSTVAEVDQERALLWKKSYEIFEKHPVAGVGAGNWQIHIPDQTLSGLWRAEDLNFTFQRPHNDFLWILDEYGLIGFNLFLIFLFSVIVAGMNAITVSGFNFDLCAALASMGSFYFISLFDFPKERMEHVIWINIILAFCLYNSIKENIPSLHFHLSNSKIILLPAAVLFLFIAFLGVMRQKGEYYTRELYKARISNNYAAIIRHAKNAQSPFYNLDPTSVPLTWYSGNAWANLKDYENAESDLKQALELNPYCRNVLNDLGSALSVEGKNAEAKKYYFEAARISPRFDDAKLNLCAIAIQEQNFKQADSLLYYLYHDSERRTQYQKIVNTMLGKDKDK